MNNELVTIINRLVEERTFSVEGVKAIEQLRQKAEAMEARISAQDETIKTLREQATMIGNERDTLKAKLDLGAKREADLTSRELKVFEHEKARAVAEARAEEVRMAMGTIFRPNSVRERWASQVPVERVFQGGGNYIETHEERKEVVREEGV